MNKKWLSLMLLLATFMVSAGKIYKWVDENGQVHYSSQKPVGQEEVETVKVRKGPKIQPKAEPAEEAAAPAEPAEGEVDPEVAKEAAKQKAKVDAELKQKQCAAARKNLAALNASTRVMQVDEATGERSMMTDDQRAKAFAQANQAIKDNCN